MKCITLTQPWATLVAIGAKKIETRNWQTSYRGPLAIHAAKGPGDFGSYKAIRDLCGTQPFFDALMTIVPNYNEYCDRDAIFEQLPSGAIVAMCELKAIARIERWTDSDWEYDSIVLNYGGSHAEALPDRPELDFGDYSPGRFAWLLADVRALPEPVLAKGALGLWNYEGEL